MGWVWGNICFDEKQNIPEIQNPEFRNRGNLIIWSQNIMGGVILRRRKNPATNAPVAVGMALPKIVDFQVLSQNFYPIYIYRYIYIYISIYIYIYNLMWYAHPVARHRRQQSSNSSCSTGKLCNIIP
jgi:hypothetical protein